MATFRDDYWARAIRLNRARAEGSDALTAERLAQAREKLAPADLAEEHEVLLTAHMPYRYLSHWERTELFWQDFKAMYRHFRAKRAPVSGEDPRKTLQALDDRTYVSIWRARQRADAIGMPYKHFIAAVMRKFEAKGSTQVPAPNQLLTDSLLEQIIEDHEDRIKSVGAGLLSGEIDPRFHAMNYVGDPVQLMALDAITSEVNAVGKSRKAIKLATHLNVQQTISEAEAVKRFGQELVDEAKVTSAGSTSIVPIRIADPKPSPPGCYGAYVVASAICGACPFRQQCTAAHEASSALLMNRFGTTDVRKKREREQARDRKRAQRLRQKEGRTVTDQELKRTLKEAGNPKAKKRREEVKARRDKKKEAAHSGADEKPDQNSGT